MYTLVLAIKGLSLIFCVVATPLEPICASVQAPSCSKPCVTKRHDAHSDNLDIIAVAMAS